MLAKDKCKYMCYFPVSNEISHHMEAYKDHKEEFIRMQMQKLKKPTLNTEEESD